MFDFKKGKDGALSAPKTATKQAQAAGVKPLSYDQVINIVAPAEARTWQGPPDLEKKFEVLEQMLASNAGVQSWNPHFQSLWNRLAEDPEVVTILTDDQLKTFFVACKRYRKVDTSRNEGAQALGPIASEDASALDAIFSLGASKGASDDPLAGLL